MKIKVNLEVGTHETKHGVDSYVRVIKKNQPVKDVVEEMQSDCDYDEENPGRGEYFDSYTETIIIDTDDFEVVE